MRNSTFRLVLTAVIAFSWSPCLAGDPTPDLSVKLVTATRHEKEALAAAMELLEKIPSGKPLMEFMRKKNFKVEFANMPSIEHGAIGRDDKGEPIIVMGRLTSGELKKPGRAAAYLAIVLAHELTHALQEYEWELADSVENECECFLKQVQIHHEICLAEGTNGPTFEDELRYRLLRSMGVDKLVDDVRSAYFDQLAARLQESVESLPDNQREAERKRIAKSWRENGESDRFRPLKDLIKEARTKERKAELETALRHWEAALKDFKAEMKNWPPVDEVLKPAVVAAQPAEPPALLPAPEPLAAPFDGAGR